MIAALVVAPLLVAGCSSAKVSADPSTTSASATSPSTIVAETPGQTLHTVMAGRGFRTDIPTGWVVRHHADDGVDTYVATPATASAPAAGSFTVTRLPFSSVPATATTGLDLAHGPLVDLLPQLIGSTSDVTEVAVTVPPHDLTLANEAAASVTMTYVEGGVPMSSQSTLIRHGSVFFVLDATASTDTFLSVLALLEQSEDRINWQ
jgi:hypothetical protein